MGKNKSYLDELYKKEELAEKRKQKAMESHKSYGCVWGKWTGMKYK